LVRFFVELQIPALDYVLESAVEQDGRWQLLIESTR
jgi:hypothetical protein